MDPMRGLSRREEESFVFMSEFVTQHRFLILRNLEFKKIKKGLGTVAHACNLSTLGS